MVGIYSFWGSKVKPDGTPSEICLPSTLNITTVCLDPEVSPPTGPTLAAPRPSRLACCIPRALTCVPGCQAEVAPGSRVSVWAARKERGPKGALEVERSLIATLQVTAAPRP